MITITKVETSVESNLSKVAYKIFDIKDYEPQFLFHGVEPRTRRVPIGLPISAEQRWVKDGTGGTKYISGFHCLESMDNAIRYAEGFKTNKDKVICPVFVSDGMDEEGYPLLRRKVHARSPVWLASELLLSGITWQEVVNVKIQKETVSHYVTMRETFLSDWGQSRDMDNILVFTCQKTEEAKALKANAKSRTDTDNIRVYTAGKLPARFYSSTTEYIQWKNKELYPGWYQDIPPWMQ